MKKANLLICSILFFISGCTIENPEDAGKFKYNFQGQNFRQIRYRSLENENAYRFHQGIRTIHFSPNEYRQDYQAYREYSLTPCYGAIKAAYSMTSREDFLGSVNETGVDTTDSNNNGVYDIFEPYGPEELGEVPVDRVDLVEYFVIANVTSNTVQPGCPITMESRIYLQFLFYQNGDLIMRDYNREIEFFFRPSP